MSTKERGEVYKCNVCGNIVEVLIVGGGELVCCEKPMELLEEKTEDEGNEKHVPVIEKTEDGVKVKVGSVPHPMEEKHHIQFIEVHSDGMIHRRYLKAGDKPEADFILSSEVQKAREYCNIHGLWGSG
ncbi:MAG: desulfoferrodoxin [Candidatus Altiarchaeales archaeon]|nr:desulfoferrodoxin [Candidatus Altiarchaeales archaeon]MBD3416398.1 desulfoferrodoxin [Candidatus Altiarchaeales archaeon]